jgi:hypothetical protein
MTHQQQALPLPAPTPGPNNDTPGPPDTPNSTQPAPVRDCIECGQVFTPVDPFTELCSEECARDWWGLEYIDFLDHRSTSKELAA